MCIIVSGIKTYGLKVIVILCHTNKADLNSIYNELKYTKIFAAIET